jgi:hypothetical protein
MMAGEFELAGCTFKVVVPLGADWVESYWAKVGAELMRGTTPTEDGTRDVVQAGS